MSCLVEASQGLSPSVTGVLVIHSKVPHSDTAFSRESDDDVTGYSGYSGRWPYHGLCHVVRCLHRRIGGVGRVSVSEFPGKRGVTFRPLTDSSMGRYPTPIRGHYEARREPMNRHGSKISTSNQGFSYRRKVIGYSCRLMISIRTQVIGADSHCKKTIIQRNVSSHMSHFHISSINVQQHT